MRRVFVSYNSRDRSRIADIVSDLESAGYEVWFDQDLTGGQEWWDVILSEIRACDAVVVAVTERALESVACRAEWQYAVDLGKAIVPLQLENTSIDFAPVQLQKRQWVDYRSADKHAAFSLVKALNNAHSRPMPGPLPPPPPLPLTYVAELRQQLESTEPLTLQQQVTIVFQLRERLRAGGDARSIERLLNELTTRDDLLAAVARDVDQLLAEARATVGTTSADAAPLAGEHKVRPTLPPPTLGTVGRSDSPAHGEIGGRQGPTPPHWVRSHRAYVGAGVAALVILATVAVGLTFRDDGASEDVALDTTVSVGVTAESTSVGLPAGTTAVGLPAETSVGAATETSQIELTADDAYQVSANGMLVGQSWQVQTIPIELPWEGAVLAVRAFTGDATVGRGVRAELHANGRIEELSTARAMIEPRWIEEFFGDSFDDSAWEPAIAVSAPPGVVADSFRHDTPWLWAPSAPEGPESVYLRYSVSPEEVLNLAGPPSAAHPIVDLVIIGVMAFELYVAGTPYLGNDWTSPETFSLELPEGRNVVAVRAFNMYGPAGVLVRLNGHPDVNSGRRWEVSSNDSIESSWTTDVLTDSNLGWSAAENYGQDGTTTTWGDALLNGEADWIWRDHKDQTPGPDTFGPEQLLARVVFDT